MNGRTLTTRLAAAGGTALAGAVLAIGPALPAHAADCTITSEGYSHQTLKICGNTHHHPKHSTIVEGSTSPQLPFTGAEITLMSAVGLGLVGGGTMLLVSGRRRRRVVSPA